MGKGKRNRKYVEGTLHKALEKLFAYKQLNRDFYFNEHVIATRPGTDGGTHLTNKPFSYAFFYDSDIDINNDAMLAELLEEFYWLNMQQPMGERVNAIFVLNKFLITWQQEGSHYFSYHPPESTQPTAVLGKAKEDTLYILYILLANVLRISEVTVPVFNRDYGGDKYLKKIEAHVFNGDGKYNK